MAKCLIAPYSNTLIVKRLTFKETGKMNYSVKPQNKDVRDLLISRQAVLSTFIALVGLYLGNESESSPINESIVREHHSLLI